MKSLPTAQFLNFQGMNMRQDPDKIDDSQSPLLLNVFLGKPGTWAKRKGSTVIGSQTSGARLKGGIEYLQYSGTRELRVILDSGVIRKTSDYATWSTVSGATFAGSMVNTALFNNNVYYISTSDFLTKDNNGSISVVGAGGTDNKIKGQNICVAQQTLFISNITYLGASGAVNYQDRVYYSFFDSSNNIPSDQLYTNATGQNTMATSTRWFTLFAPVTCSFSFGITGLSYHFTESACYQFDLRNASNSIGVQKVFDIGCAGPRACWECNGWMMWIDKEGRRWAWGGAGVPIPLSWDLEDEANGQSVISQINPTTLATACGGGFRSEFWSTLGNMTVFNETLTNSVLRGLITQNFQGSLWSVDTYPVLPAFFFKAKINGTPAILFGSSTTNDLYQMNTSAYNDNNTAINFKAKTKFFVYNTPFKSNEQQYLYIQYKPQTANPDYLVVKYATDSNLTYTTLTDPVGGVTTDHGVVNMYDANAATIYSGIKMLSLPQNILFRNCSYEFSNSQLNQGAEISGIGMESAQKDLGLLPAVS